MQSTSQTLSTRLAAEEAVHSIKTEFEKHLKQQLGLCRISAPAIVLEGTGINDDLNGIERPVGFPVKAMQEGRAEVVQSLAKWKRLRLRDYHLEPGEGIVTDMRALRPDEELGPLHSISVDQWDWEKVIHPEQRNLDYLKQQVEKIYQAILATRADLQVSLTPALPKEIRFVHTEDLLRRYPALSPKQREDRAAKEFGAVFLIGIGGDLETGQPHDGRAPDYDDWSTPTSTSTKGLNGDLLLWNPILNRAVEISSMGIRVDANVLDRQLKERGAQAKMRLFYHRELLAGKLPQTIGGGIGQSRLCMFLLQKRHIGEVQASLWPKEMRADCAKKGIFLL